MSLGSNTQVIDGQRNTFPSSYAFQPTQYGPQTTGVPQVSPTMPPFLGAASGAGSSTGAGMEGVAGYGTAGNNALVTQIANGHPFNLKVSPTLWAVLVLIVGLVALQAVHWRKTTLEGVSESGHVGEAREAASESA